MIPSSGSMLHNEFQFEEMPTRTFKLNPTYDYVTGHADRLDAMRQAVYLILSVERYQFIIHDWNYGVELSNLIGRPVSFALPEIKRRVTEALLQDSRITGVETFAFSVKKGVVHTTFTVKTIFGDIPVEKAVTI